MEPLELALKNPGFNGGSMRPPRGPPSNTGGGQTPSAYNQGARTPARGDRTPGWGGGRTPNPYGSGDGRASAWGRTPNPYAADGGKTPAWNPVSRTPNPYGDGGTRTPAWNATSRTPNPYLPEQGRTPRHTGSNSDAAWAPPAWGEAADSWVSFYSLLCTVDLRFLL